MTPSITSLLLSSFSLSTSGTGRGGDTTGERGRWPGGPLSDSPLAIKLLDDGDAAIVV